MHRYMIVCPYCQGTCPADARFCIECRAALQQAATNTTHRLIDSPDLNVKTRMPVTHHATTFGQIRIRLIGPMLCGVLMVLVMLAHRAFRLDTVALLILMLGVVQFVRGTMRSQIIGGLRAAVIAVALVLAMRTPWMLTISIVAGAVLASLHLINTRGIPNHRRP
jgi:hypothetical protein